MGEHDNELTFTTKGGVMAGEDSKSSKGEGDANNNNNAVEKGSGGKAMRKIPKGFRKPGKCSICMEEFKTVTQLKVHERKAHTGKTVFLCEDCGVECAWRSDWLRHKKKHM